MVHISPYGPLCTNVTSSIKPEVHSVSQRRQRRTEPRPQEICAQNLVKLSPAVPKICSQTDRQTDRQTRWLQYSAPLRGEVIRRGYSGKCNMSFIEITLKHVHIKCNNTTVQDLVNRRVNMPKWKLRCFWLKGPKCSLTPPVKTSWTSNVTGRHRGLKGKLWAG